MIKFKKLTIALLALLSVSATAWADGVTASEIDATVSAGWSSSSDESLIKASDLPGYNKITLEQAVTWASAPASGTVYLIYEIVADGELKIAEFKDGNYTDSFGWSEETHYSIWEDINYGDKRYFYTTGPAASGPEVTIDNTLEQPEATFTMPQYDVTATYALKRDMAVDVTAEVGDGSDGYRIRIKKDGNDYVPVNTEEMLISVSDDLDDQNPIDLTANTDVTLLVQKKGEGDTWTDLSNEDKLSVGTFRYKVTGTGNYTGTIYSNEFQLFQGYEVTIPAGEYITYYKDEALMVEDEDAQLYTITAVGSDKATATELKVAPAETPLLVKNNAKETKTIVLIPTKETADNVKAADEFKGTLTAGTIAASTDAVSRYAFNGLQFVWVKNAIEIGANKCWLEIGAEKTSARSLNIDFGDGTTGISNVLSDGTAGDWYDLNGRKYATKPTRKGVYINNGRKVVIK